MKRLLALLISIFISTSFIHAELLIVKHKEDLLIPLDANDGKNHTALADLLLKYQWPMVITNSTLTQKERDELLTPDKPYAEENFIKNKLQKIDPHYDVAFLPTALYELFIASYYKNEQENALHLTASRLNLIDENTISDEINKILTNPHEKKETEYEHLYAVYTKFNNEFYKDVFFTINNALATFLCKQGSFTSTQDLTDNIQKRACKLAALWINSAKPTIKETQNMWPISYATYFFQKATETIIQKSVIQKVFELEYEARKLNKGLLFRGSNTLKNIHLGTRKGTLAGSTVIEYQTTDNADLYKKYKEKTIKPYSISFGNSLFAGAFSDTDATVYSFLASNSSDLGYALLINKKTYLHDYINNLFFISPLAALTAFFGSGEYFHSRAKGALAIKKPGEAYTMSGICPELAGCPIDTAGAIIIQRDPLRHAELFSNFLAENMRIIKAGNHENLSSEEIKAYEAVLQEEQKKAASFYKAIPRLERFATKASKTFRQKQAEKKQKETREKAGLKPTTKP